MCRCAALLLRAPLAGGIPHRVGGGALLGKVDDRVRLLVLEKLRELVVLPG